MVQVQLEETAVLPSNSASGPRSDGLRTWKPTYRLWNRQAPFGAGGSTSKGGGVGCSDSRFARSRIPYIIRALQGKRMRGGWFVPCHSVIQAVADDHPPDAITGKI